MGLFDFIKNMPTVNEIYGSMGEWFAKIYMERQTDMLVLHDVLIDGANGYTSQIDLILIGNKGLYIIEIKMFDEARIYGDVTKQKWYYYKYGNKYEIYNPIMQNKKHVNYLKRFLKDFGDIPFFSIVTMFCDDYKVTGDYGEDIVICNSLPMMEQSIYKISENKNITLDDKKKQEIFEYIKKNQYAGKEARTEHKKKVNAYKEMLDEMEIRNLCPYCKVELVLREGKNGKFYGCRNFPRCRYTKNFYSGR